MISIEKFKELLGGAGEGLTDKEIEQIRTLEYEIADAIFDFILLEKNGNPQKINSRSLPVIVYNLHLLRFQMFNPFLWEILGLNILSFHYENRKQ
jgi:hypothetical protein